MKKAYVKPEIMFDGLELSNNIASGCEIISSNQARYSCPVKITENGWIIFQQTTGCVQTPPGGNDSVCYDIPMESNNVFTS